MRFEVNVDKKYFFAIVLIGLVFIGIVGVIASNPAVFGHKVDEINWAQAIPGNVTATGFCIGTPTNCKTDWSGLGISYIAGDGITITGNQINATSSTGTGGGGSQWKNTTGGILYYTDGKVGIGTATPSVKLDVVGDVNFGPHTNVNGEDFNSTAWVNRQTETDTCIGNDVINQYECGVDEVGPCRDVATIGTVSKYRTWNCLVGSSGISIGASGGIVIGSNVGIGGAANSGGKLEIVDGKARLIFKKVVGNYGHDTRSSATTTLTSITGSSDTCVDGNETEKCTTSTCCTPSHTDTCYDVWTEVESCTGDWCFPTFHYYRKTVTCRVEYRIQLVDIQDEVDGVAVNSE